MNITTAEIIWAFFAMLPGQLFFCLQCFIPLLFLTRLFKSNSSKIDMRSLVIATNITILIAGLVTVVVPIVIFVHDYWSGGEYEQYTFTSSYTVPFGMFIWMGLIGRVLIPQLMWIPAFRRSIISAYTWLIATWLFAIVNFLLLKYVVEVPETRRIGYHPFNWGNYLQPIPVFLVIIFLVYFVVKRKDKRLSHDI